MFFSPIAAALMPSFGCGAGGSTGVEATDDSVVAGSEDSSSHGGDSDTEEREYELSHDQLNVVFILADTVRADHLGMYGYERDTTPQLDAWSEGAVVFEDYTSQAGITIQSISSLISSLVPAAHGCCDASAESDEPLSDAVDTLAERLQAGGWRTAGLYKSEVTKRAGFEQGYDFYEQVDGTVNYHESGRELTDAALGWLDENAEGDAPFFLYLHYMDAHIPYQAPDPWYDMFDAGFDSLLTGKMGELTNELQPTEQDLKRIRALYDGEIAYMDDQLGRVFDALQSIRDQTVIVFVGDHGEQFYEHEGWRHEHLYEENLRCPLIISAPGLPAGRISGRVQGIDVAPTLASLVGFEPAESWTGRDLSEVALTGGGVESDWMLSQLISRYAVYSPEGMKYIVQSQSKFLYDLNADPDETENLFGTERDTVRLMEEQADLMLSEARALFESIHAEGR